MFCYGEKENWYKRIVPSGMLPALAIDDKLYTESDHILYALEDDFGPLARGMQSPSVIPLRKLERALFSSWCQWLCYPNGPRQERNAKTEFERVASIVNKTLSKSKGPYFLPVFSEADVIFAPYIERMAASLFYYKGYDIKGEYPAIASWFRGMEARTDTYRGTQSDYHTHCHDLPPQMGGTYSNDSAEARIAQKLVDGGLAGDSIPEASYEAGDTSALEGLSRVVKHRASIMKANPNSTGKFDEALRAALTVLAGGDASPPKGTAADLRYLRDRINVPRDMSLHAARKLRFALETTAGMDSDAQGSAIPVRHRRDQDPRMFRNMLQ